MQIGPDRVLSCISVMPSIGPAVWNRLAWHRMLVDHAHLMSCTAGYGFVSFSDAIEGARALREMNGRYIGNRPCKLSKSTWDVRPYSSPQTTQQQQVLRPVVRFDLGVHWHLWDT